MINDMTTDQINVPTSNQTTVEINLALITAGSTNPTTAAIIRIPIHRARFACGRIPHDNALLGRSSATNATQPDILWDLNTAVNLHHLTHNKMDNTATNGVIKLIPEREPTPRHGTMAKVDSQYNSLVMDHPVPE